VICGVIGAGVELSGLSSMLRKQRLVPPPVPEAWAPLPTSERIDVTLVASAGLVDGLVSGLSGAEIALHQDGAVAFVDGRVFAVNAASARNLLRALAWKGLPIYARQASAAELDTFAAPAAVPLAWRAHRLAYTGLQRGRELAAAHPAGVAASAAVPLLFLLAAGLNHLPRRTVTETPSSRERSPWRPRLAKVPVRVVLVPDQATLEQVRVAIGEEHIVAASEHAFAFTDGWILAARKGSVFELMSELGWRMRPLEMATRSELAAQGYALSAVPRDDGSDALGLLEALQVCGPLAHGTGHRSATGALSHA
jgi:hypothetical protein